MPSATLQTMPATPPSAPTPLTPPMPGPSPQAPGTFQGQEPSPKAPMSKAPLPATDVLDLPPEQAAIALLRAANPDAAAKIRSRLEAITSEVADLVEEARTTTLRLDHFMYRAASLLGERRSLDGQLRLLGAEVAVRPHPANEVLDLVRSVARFRDLAQLRAYRPELIDKLEREIENLDHADFGLRSHLAVPPNAYYADRTRAWLDKTTDYLTRRRALIERINRLDPKGNAGRAALVKDAVERHGGADHLVAALAPTLPAPTAGKIPAAKAAVASLDQKLEATDPESRLAASLREQRQQAHAALPALHQAVVDEQTAAAQAIVSRALSKAHGGRFADVAELAGMVRAAGKQELAKDVDAIGHEDGTAVYIVHELIG